MSRLVSLSRLAALASSATIIAGCSGGLHSDAPPTQVYILRATASTPAAAANGEAVARPLDAPGTASAEAPSVQLPRPSADPGLSTELIVLTRSDHRLDYYSGSTWAGALPDVVSTLALDANTRRRVSLPRSHRSVSK